MQSLRKDDNSGLFKLTDDKLVPLKIYHSSLLWGFYGAFGSLFTHEVSN